MAYSLGRKPNTPDDRDWTSDKLHAHLRATAAPIDPLLDTTVRDLPFTTWKQVLAFASALWAWLKHKPTPPPPTPPTFKVWGDDLVLDQGDYGTCVGNAGAGWLRADPVNDPNVNETVARSLYYDATCIDGQCDNTYQEGSTSRSLAKVLQNRKRLSAYAYAKTLTDINEWLDNHGPVMVGADWTEDMFNPDVDGFVHATGSVAGGHEWLLLGRESANVYRAVNSWGTGWGLSGQFRITADDLNTLIFTQNGDALLAAELPL